MKTNKYAALRHLRKRIFLVGFLSVLLSPVLASGSGSGHEKEEGFNPGKMIIHHITDGYKWHFFNLGSTGVTLYLPVILYSPGAGLEVFSSKNFTRNENHTYRGYKLDHGKLTALDGHQFYDLSITKNVASMMISAVLLLLIFISVARRYKKRPKEAPKGVQSLLEPVILFVRDEIAIPVLGRQYYRKYFPFLITLFFFIWLNNMLGLMPGAANVTGNTAVTGALALLTLLVTNISGKREYWGHIFAPPGLPVWLLPVMWIVELLSILTKPFALMIRLYANIAAGHILVFSILSLIFIFGFKSPGIGFGVSPFSIAFAVFLYFLELLVAAIQAYIFAMLSAVFIGQAVRGE